MESAILVIIFSLALIIIINQVRKQFDSECEGCGGDCGCCRAYPAERHLIKQEDSKEGGENEEPEGFNAGTKGKSQ